MKTNASLKVIRSAHKKERQPQNLSSFTARCRTLLICLALVLAFACAAQAQELSNDALTLRLNVSPEGIPVIEQATLKATGKVAFRDMGTPDGLGAWVPAALIPATQPASPVWEIT